MRLEIFGFEVRPSAAAVRMPAALAVRVEESTRDRPLASPQF
jgi:hypothetical protein